jgi:hypothetical protein
MLSGWQSSKLHPEAAADFVLTVLDSDPDSNVRDQALLAVGTVDHPRARERLVEQIGLSGDRYREGSLASGVQNALWKSPTDWVEKNAIPYFRRRIATAQDPRREYDRWRSVLERTHPAVVDMLEEPREGEDEEEVESP